MKQTVALILLLCLASNKHESKPKAEPKPLYESQLKRMKKLRDQAILHGDPSTHGTFLEYASNYGDPYENLSVSLLVNHKHKTPESFYWTFTGIIELQNDRKFKVSYLQKLDDANRQFAFHYLLEAAKRDYISAQADLEKVYRNGYGFEKDPHKADSMYTLLENKPSLGSYYKRHRNNKAEIDKIR